MEVKIVRAGPRACPPSRRNQSAIVRRAGTGARPYVSLMILFLPLLCYADTPQDLYKSGNALYAEGKFADAAQKYQSAADAGLRNWVLEYDLGNACYRAGQIGKGILHYERAFRINSGQGDVIYNLNLATTKAGDPELPTTALPALGWRLFYIFSVNTLTILSSFLFVSFCVVGGCALLDRYVLPRDVALGGGLLFVFLFGWLAARIFLLEKPTGVVVSPVAEVRSGPNTSYPANFTIPEGRRVLILKEQEPIQGWLEIGVPQEGLKGWVPDSSVEII
jgi:hypothetical protein